MRYSTLNKSPGVKPHYLITFATISISHVFSSSCFYHKSLYNLISDITISTRMTVFRETDLSCSSFYKQATYFPKCLFNSNRLSCRKQLKKYRTIDNNFECIYVIFSLRFYTLHELAETIKIVSYSLLNCITRNQYVQVIKFRFV